MIRCPAARVHRSAPRPAVPRLLRSIVAALAALGLAAAPPAAAAPSHRQGAKEAKESSKEAKETKENAKEAAKHFSRGVALYNEADYRAALVEFKRAYELAPNAAVLYNIGQTHFQLQSYAAALATFERYLADGGPGAGHRAEVEQSLETLRARVGKLDVKTNVPGVELAIDDEPAGQTPLDRPIVVSIGRRKVVATLAGQPAQTRTVEVAAEETSTVSLAFTDPTAPRTASTGSSRGRSLRIGWIAAGALGAGALTLGTLAFVTWRDLDDLRGSFPVTHEELDAKSSRLGTLSLAADILGVAALVTGGVTLYLSRSRARAQEVRVGLAPRGLQLTGNF
jgi:hypothetical protein